MKRYWYTYFLIISLCIAAVIRVIPDSVFSAAAGKFFSRTDVSDPDAAVKWAENNPAEVSQSFPASGGGAEEAEAGESEGDSSEDPIGADASSLNDAAAGAEVSPDSSESDDAAAGGDSGNALGSSESGGTAAGDGSGNVLDASPSGGTSESGTAIMKPVDPDFRGVLFIGDSRTMGLSEYGNLGSADVFANSGMSVFNLFRSTEKMKDGSSKTLDELLNENQYDTIFLMLGINELGYEYDKIIAKYQETIDTIKTKQPNAQLILEANLHVTAQKAAANQTFNNQNINKINGAIKEIAAANHCPYIDINTVFDDETGNLHSQYSTDGSHILGKYYSVWVEWLKTVSSEAPAPSPG